jgi:glycosyltransferase involved in cell wall biosynthesis
VSFHPGLDTPRDDVLEGVRVHRFPATRRFGNLTLGRRERRTTAAALRRIRPDVAHAHVLGPAALGAAESGFPWVATAHGMQAAEGPTLRGWRNRVRSMTYVRMERMSLRGLRHLIVISPYVMDYFADRAAGVTAHPIENPVAARFFDVRRAPRPGVLLFSGRLIPRKDLETLIDALGALGPDRTPRLRVAGAADDPEYAAALHARAGRAGVGERVDLLGPLPPARLEDELAAASVFVQSSRQETASVAVAEAMAAGVPVVATDVGGTRHLVEEGRSGRLVPPCDPARLAEALAAYLDDPAGAEAAGLRGREIAEERFRVERVVDRTLGVYRRAREEAAASRADNPLDRVPVID